ncbi:MAG: hypothetical protein PHG36_09565, partial [Dehalococcoidia bacterium]|nr:hypothetical protein [Dehalococcoidia bacterium]
LEYAIIEVVDNGEGFDLDKTMSDKAARSSIGLITMKERAEMLGGNLTIDTAYGKGTRIFVRIPISQRADSLEVHHSAINYEH